MNKAISRLPIEPKEWAIPEDVVSGLAIRLDMLQTHYRAPKDFTATGLNGAAKTLRKWLSIAERGEAVLPQAFLDAMLDDMNTAKAIAEMHKLSKADPQGLHSAMTLLGLIPAGYDGPVPIEKIPLPQWVAK